MRVLQLTDGQHMIPYCRALRERGISATACHFYGNRYHFEPDVCLHLEQYPAEQRPAILKQYMEQAMQEYDVFHFYFGFTFLPDKSDLHLLAAAGKKLIVHHQGSEVRQLSIAEKHNPHVRVKPGWTEQRIATDLERISQVVRHAIIPYYELLPYVQPYYKHIHYLPNAIELGAIQPEYPSGKGPVRIVHAPTNRFLKGTEFIEEAIAQLRREGLDLQFTLIENLTHAEATAAYQQADLVIDQLRIGDYGLVSIEAMAMGKAVICFMRKDLLPKYPGLPIVSASPLTLTHTLRDLLHNPRLLQQLGRRGRAYAETHHDVSKAADKLVALYYTL